MWKLFTTELKMKFRNKQAIFWSLAFPLIFTVIFGFFFGNNNQSVGTLVLVNKSNSILASATVDAIKNSNAFKIKESSDAQEGKDLMSKSQAVLTIVIPEKFGEDSADAPSKIITYTDPANAQANSAAYGILTSVFTEASLKAQNATQLFGIDDQKTKTSEFSYFSFVLVGLIGMALMNSSVQGMAISLSRYRDEQILKRIKSTPLKPSVFVVSEILSELVINFIQVTLIILLGHYAFGASFVGSLVTLYGLAMLGALLFLVVGFFVAAVSKTTDAAEGMATAVTVPMMFLAGVFFPMDSLPTWLFLIVQYLPLAPLLRMMRGVAIDGVSAFANPMNIYIVVGWIVVLLFLTVKKFKFYED